MVARQGEFVLKVEEIAIRAVFPRRGLSERCSLAEPELELGILQHGLWSQ
jgi:hypothetical protein